MAFKYDPKDARDCLAEGSYDAELTSVEEKISSKGNPMLAIVWTVPWDGRDWTVRDWIVNPGTLFKLKKLALACHQGKEFEELRFDLTDHIGRAFTLTLEVESSASYGDQNKVTGYGESSGMPPREIGPPPPKTEEIPF